MRQQVKAIRKQRDHDAAILRLSALMDEDVIPGSCKEAELELPALVVDHASAARSSQWCSTRSRPSMLRMTKIGLGKVDLASCAGSPPRVSEVLALRVASTSRVGQHHRSRFASHCALLRAGTGPDHIVGDRVGASLRPACWEFLRGAACRRAVVAFSTLKPPNGPGLRAA